MDPNTRLVSGYQIVLNSDHGLNSGHSGLVFETFIKTGSEFKCVMSNKPDHCWHQFLNHLKISVEKVCAYPIIIEIYRLAVEAVLSHPSGTQALNKNKLRIKFKLVNLIKKIEMEKHIWGPILGQILG